MGQESSNRFGIAASKWVAAKQEARGVLVERARRGGVVSYSELVDHIGSLSLRAKDPRLDDLLDQLCREEYVANGMLLSAIVVYKHDRSNVGQGFFKTARSLGFEVVEREMDNFLSDQIKRVHSYWKSH